MLDVLQRMKGSEWGIPSSEHCITVFLVVLEDILCITWPLSKHWTLLTLCFLDCIVRKNPQSRQEKQLVFLVARQKEFKEAALQAKRNGEINQAKEYLRLAKGFDPLIEASNSGLPVDMDTVSIIWSSFMDDTVLSFLYWVMWIPVIKSGRNYSNSYGEPQLFSCGGTLTIYLYCCL